MLKGRGWHGNVMMDHGQTLGRRVIRIFAYREREFRAFEVTLKKKGGCNVSLQITMRLENYTRKDKLDRIDLYYLPTLKDSICID